MDIWSDEEGVLGRVDHFSEEEDDLVAEVFDEVDHSDDFHEVEDPREVEERETNKLTNLQY